MQPLPNLYSLLLMGNIWTLQSILFCDTETMKGNKAQKASSPFTKAQTRQLSDYMLLSHKKEIMPNCMHEFNIYSGITHTIVYLSMYNCAFSSI